MDAGTELRLGPQDGLQHPHFSQKEYHQRMEGLSHRIARLTRRAQGIENHIKELTSEAITRSKIIELHNVAKRLGAPDNLPQAPGDIIPFLQSALDQIKKDLSELNQEREKILAPFIDLPQEIVAHIVAQTDLPTRETLSATARLFRDPATINLTRHEADSLLHAIVNQIKANLLSSRDKQHLRHHFKTLEKLEDKIPRKLARCQSIRAIAHQTAHIQNHIFHCLSLFNQESFSKVRQDIRDLATDPSFSHNIFKHLLLDELGEVLDIVQKIYDEHGQSRQIPAEAENLARQGNYNKALFVSHLIGNNPARAQCIRNIARIQAQRGNLDLALTTVKQIKHHKIRREAFEEIFYEAPTTTLDSQEKTKKIAYDIPDLYDREVALTGLARKITSNGLVDEACNILKTLNHGIQRTLAFKQVFNSFVRQSKNETLATQLAKQLDTQEDQEAAFKGIAQAHEESSPDYYRYKAPPLAPMTDVEDFFPSEFDS